MRLTVPYPVSPNDVSEKKLTDWANDEARTVLEQARKGLNVFCTERGTANTAGDGAWTRVWTSAAMPTNCTTTLLATVAAVTTSGAAQRAAYLLFATFESTSSTCAQVGATVALASHETAAAIDARFGVDTALRQAYVEFRDDAVSPMRVAAVVQQSEVLPT